jgi:hypothetical protein
VLAHEGKTAEAESVWREGLAVAQTEMMKTRKD